MKWSVKRKLRLLKFAKKLGNITEACRRMGCSTPTYYNYKRKYEEGGNAALRYEFKNWEKAVLKNRIPLSREVAVIDLALTNPLLGKSKISKLLTLEGIPISPTAVKAALVRHDMETIEKRVVIFEKTLSDQENITLDQLKLLEKAKKMLPKRQKLEKMFLKNKIPVNFDNYLSLSLKDEDKHYLFTRRRNKNS